MLELTAEGGLLLTTAVDADDKGYLIVRTVKRKIMMLDEFRNVDIFGLGHVRERTGNCYFIISCANECRGWGMEWKHAAKECKTKCTRGSTQPTLAVSVQIV